TAAVRSFRLLFPVRVSIERAYLRFYGSGDAPVNIALEKSGVPVAGVPFLSVTPGGTDGSVSAFNGDRVTLNADTEYVLRMESTGSFSSKNTFVELHVRA